MELDLFKAFVTIADVRSFRRAAAIMHVSQPTLSRQIARLEAELGTQLFERYGRHVGCTVNGEILLPLAQAIIARTNDTVRLMREREGTAAVAVRFGADGAVFAHFLTPILRTFITTYPTVRLDLDEKGDVQLEEAVTSGELDCAVMTPWGSKRAAARHLLTEPILLLVPRNHRFAGFSAVPINLLENEPLLLPPSCVNASNIVIDSCRRAGFEPRIACRAHYPEFLKNLARTGLGLAPMPRILAAPETLEGLVALPFQEPIVRDLFLVYPSDRPLSAGARVLMAHIRSHASTAQARSAKPRKRLTAIRG